MINLEKKQNQISLELTGKWKCDSWLLNNLVNYKIEENVKCELEFNCKSSTINNELKFVFKKKIIKREWAFYTIRAVKNKALINIISYFNSLNKKYSSIVLESLSYWTTSLYSYLKENGLLTIKDHIREDPIYGPTKYKNTDYSILAFKQIYLTIENFYENSNTASKIRNEWYEVGFPQYRDSCLSRNRTIQREILKICKRKFVKKEWSKKTFFKYHKSIEYILQFFTNSNLKYTSLTKEPIGFWIRKIENHLKTNHLSKSSWIIKNEVSGCTLFNYNEPSIYVFRKIYRNAFNSDYSIVFILGSTICYKITEYSNNRIKFFLKWSFIKCDSKHLKKEMSLVCRNKIENGEWSEEFFNERLSSLVKIVYFLNSRKSKETSFLSRSIHEWEKDLISYLEKYNLEKKSPKKMFNKHNVPIIILNAFYTVSFFKQIYRCISKLSNNYFNSDIWKIRDNNSINGIKSIKSFNFEKIPQEWVKVLVKKFIQICLVSNAKNTVQRKLSNLNTFSKFLSIYFPAISVKDFNRDMILDYLKYINNQNYFPKTIMNLLSTLKNFLEICVRENYIRLEEKCIIYYDDSPKGVTISPKYIPQEVLLQLERNLKFLPKQFNRMLFILRECGMRISELLHLQFDCIFESQNEDYYLKYYIFKMNKEHKVFITRETKEIVLEQQEYIKKNDLDSFDLLFPSNKGKPHSGSYFSQVLNKLSIERKIVDLKGKIFHFNAHQFRHTLGSDMINNGVSQEIIQSILGHESSFMTSIYAHIYDETKKKKFEEFYSEMVSINGIFPRDSKSVNSSELQWLKKNLLAQALPNGYCSLPILKGSCPNANSCLVCDYFVSNKSFLKILKFQLKETKRILTVAKKNNWERQLEINKKVEQNLIRIIANIKTCRK